MLIKQPKRNKWTTLYEQSSYTINDIKGSQIHARHVTDGREECRDASHFKIANQVVDARDDTVDHLAEYLTINSHPNERLDPQDKMLGKQTPETREEEKAEDPSETSSLTSQTTEVAMEPDSVIKATNSNPRLQIKRETLTT